MRGKKKYVYITLDRDELRLLREGMLWFRNDVLRRGGPTEDIDGVLVKLMK